MKNGPIKVIWKGRGVTKTLQNSFNTGVIHVSRETKFILNAFFSPFEYNPQPSFLRESRRKVLQ